MATTTNYGWTTPDDTALVKDGASAIRTLGSSIDTSLNTALGTKKAGLVLLSTTSPSASSAHSVSDVFSTTYDNYRIVVNATTLTGTLTMRLRVSGADNSTSSYKYVIAGASLWTNSAYGGFNSSSDTSWGVLGESSPTSLSLDIMNPFNTAKTFAHGQTSQNDRGRAYNAIFDATTSFTGFTLLSTSLTGTVSVYGYNK